MISTGVDAESTVKKLMILAVALAAVALPGSAWTAPDKVPVIKGSVWGYTAEGAEEALVSATIELRPVAPLRGKDKRPAPDLVGVGVTDAKGDFSIPELTSRSRQTSYPLMKNWTYLAKVVAPGHYVFQMVVEYRGEDEPWDFMLEAKVTDVVDESGTITPDERQLQRGATRRGDQ